MGKDVKVKIWGNANKILEENLNDISDRLLENVYKDADRMLYDIIISSRKNEINNIREKQIANVISFLGKRGRGKTSAMFSFYSYLSNMNKRKVPEWSKFWKGYEQEFHNDYRYVFHEINYIDAAMLSENESIIDTILAKMWDKFDEYLKKPGYYKEHTQYEYLVKELKDDFLHVRNAYLNMRYEKSVKEIEQEKSTLTAASLHERALSINLKESMAKLVSNYIRLFNYNGKDFENSNGYLVLAIDDVDMANDAAWDILQQIHTYMSIPKVIILLTADLERLKKVCEVSCKNGEFSEEEKYRFVSDYLGKVLPINMRIYMPELADKQNVIIEDDNKLAWNTHNEKDMILELMAKNFDMYFVAHRGKRHFLQNDSIRSLVNYFEKFSKVIDDNYIDWLKIDLQERLIERVEDKEQRNFLKSLYRLEYADINSFVLNYIKKEIEFTEMDYYIAEESLGKVLYNLNALEKRNVEYRDFVRCILLFYMIILYDCKDNKKIRDAIIGNSVLGSWEYGFVSSINQHEAYITGSETRMSFKFEIGDLKDSMEQGAIEQVMKKILVREKSQIMGWIYTLLYVNAETSVYKNYHIEVSEELVAKKEGNNEQVDCWVIKPYISMKKSLFGFLHRNIDDYIETINQLLESIVTELYLYLVNKYKLKSNKKILDRIIKSYLELIYEIDIQQFDFNSVLLENVEILYYLGQILERERLTGDKNIASKTDDIIEKLRVSYQIITRELSDIEIYYDTHVIQPKDSFINAFIQNIQVQLVFRESTMPPEVRAYWEEYMKSLYKSTSFFYNVPEPQLL